jgi:hypothetical protein
MDAPGPPLDGLSVTSRVTPLVTPAYLGESPSKDLSSWSLVSDSDAKGTVEHGPHHSAPG